MSRVPCILADILPEPEHQLVGATSHYRVAVGVDYECRLEHRGGGWALKSKWDVTRLDECRVFVAAAVAGWLLDCVAADGSVENRRGWGVRLGANGPEYLGSSRNDGYPVFVAKFVDGTSSHTWHGYPADNEGNVNDIPDPEILALWADVVLPPAKIIKLSRQRRC